MFNENLFAPIKPVISVDLDAETHRITSERISYNPAVVVIDSRDELRGVEKTIQDKNAEKAEVEAEIQKIKRELEKRTQHLYDAKKEIEADIWQLRKTKRAAEQAVYVAENHLREALNNEKVREAFKARSEEFEDATREHKWREFAFEHQIYGAKMLAAAGSGILGDKMGLGKTLTSLIMADMLKVNRLLVIVPDDVVSNFVSEISNWAPHRTVVPIGKKSKLERDAILSFLAMTDQFTVVVNYSAWRKDKSLLFKLVAKRFEMVIMDEAHIVKSVSTASYKGCEKIVLADNCCPKCGGGIQEVKDNSERTRNYDDRGGYLPRNFPVCIGNNSPLDRVQSVDKVAFEGCGWSKLVDIAAGVERPYGALRSVKHVLPMTGTVILNKPTDIFALLKLIDPAVFHSERQFKNTYCITGWDNKVTFRPGGLKALTNELAGRYISRDRKSAGIVLPEQTVTVHDIEITEDDYPGQMKVIKQLSQHAMLAFPEGKLPIMQAIALITRKRQANVWPAGIEFNVTNPETGVEMHLSIGDEVRESIKVDRIISEPTAPGEDYEGLIPDITGNGDRINGERALVFSQFRGPLEELERRMKNAGIDVVRFDGSTPTKIRDQIKTDFDRKVCDQPGYEYKWQVALINYKTGGVGLNLTGATHTILLDEEWNAGKNDQAMNRTDRIGQTEESSVHILRLSGTIDTWIANLIQTKREMAEGFESNASLAADLFKSMRDGDVL